MPPAHAGTLGDLLWGHSGTSSEDTWGWAEDVGKGYHGEGNVEWGYGDLTCVGILGLGFWVLVGYQDLVCVGISGFGFCRNIRISSLHLCGDFGI